MIEFLRRMEMRSAAKRYAARLGRTLSRNFGPSPTYTPKQIQRGVSDCALDPNYIVFAYAAFLPETEFDARLLEMPVKLSYHEARELYLRFVPAKKGPVIREAHEIGDGATGGDVGGD